MSFEERIVGLSDLDELLERVCAHYAIFEIRAQPEWIEACGGQEIHVGFAVKPRR